VRELEATAHLEEERPKVGRIIARGPAEGRHIEVVGNVSCEGPETTKLIGREAFAAMKPGVILVNVARGEIVDEEALIAALATGKLRGGGAALDVYVGEFEHEPDRRLWDAERVLITPHVSGGSDMRQIGGSTSSATICAHYLDGRPLTNVVDWADGH